MEYINDIFEEDEALDFGVDYEEQIYVDDEGFFHMIIDDDDIIVC